MQRKHHLILYALLALCLVLAVAWAAQAESEKNRLARALEEGYAGALEDAMARMRQLRGNIDKLCSHYPEGFEAERSIERHE